MALKFFCLHGVNTEENDITWQNEWQAIVASKLPGALCYFVKYNDIFQTHSIQASMAASIRKQSQEWLENEIKLEKLNIQNILENLDKFIDDVDENERGNFRQILENKLQEDFHAEYTPDPFSQTIMWLSIPEIRAKVRQTIIDQLNTEKPDVICAHSLGSLVAYDTFIQNPQYVKDKIFITFGSQLPHFPVPSVFEGGIIKGLPLARRWFHLYNMIDMVYANVELLPQNHNNFTSINTLFADSGFNHRIGSVGISGKTNKTGYLTHSEAKQIWAALSQM